MTWITLFLFYLTSLFFPSSIQAASTYQIDYQTTYRVVSENLTFVEHRITLTNQLANIYPTSYTISIGTNNLRQIKVTVNNQPVKPKIDLSQNNVTISFPISNPQIGYQKTNQIKISYFNPTILEKLGRTYEINLPRLARANEAHSYQRTLIIPTTFPPLSLAVPRPTKTQTTSTQQIFTWSGYPNQNIALLFGQYQTYKLNLTYHLRRSDLQTSLTEIALPPDTAYQRVYLQTLTPSPQLIKRDLDGNWLAQYDLSNQDNLTVKAELYVQVYPQPHFSLPLPTEKLDYLLRPTKFWPSHDQTVKRLAQQLKTPLNIYNYLINNFVYNYSKVNQPERLGAVKALKNPQLAICTEFTDTFIALARSLGIPAREINGYAYTTNKQLRPLDLSKDILHAWPEYFDAQKKQWRSVDPTWGNTTGGVDYFHKLDFNHIVFVRHGQEDNYPPPAGAYKTDPTEKSLQVTLVDQPPQPREDYQIKNNLLINTGNVALVNKTIKLPQGKTITIDYLPPYGQLPLNPTTPHSSFSPQTLILSAALVLTVIIFLVYLKLKS